MIMNVWNLKEVVIAYFEVLFQNSNGETEEKQNKSRY